MSSRIEGNIVDVFNRKIYPGIVIIENGIITNIIPSKKKYDVFISPGFIDAHVHIESSMLTPEEFSKIAIQKGTIAVVTDPHEIANVLGMEGIQFMLKNAEQASIKIFFTIPSCVPSTPFDRSGAIITAKDVEILAKSGKFIGLSEVMNVPGVLLEDTEVIHKIEIAKNNHLLIDGHAPQLTGDALKKYVGTGISTDHECANIEEALEKIALGMKILIREGSAAKNYEALKQLISSNPDQIMFCTDDSHPRELINEGQIDKIVKKALHDGYDIFDIIRIAAINPINHYGLDVGMLRKGDPADFVVFKDLSDFSVYSVYLRGEMQYSADKKEIYSEGTGEKQVSINKFIHDPLIEDDISKKTDKEIIAIKIIDNEIITEKSVHTIPEPVDNFEADTKKDILKLVYLNRYTNGSPQIAYITGFGIKKGAFATSVAHDSHNIIAVGTNDRDIVHAINTIIEGKGGLSVVSDSHADFLNLPIAGIMTDIAGKEVADKWDLLKNQLSRMGCKLTSPFMTLSFMSLIVIPEIKIGERGLFEFSRFDFLNN